MVTVPVTPESASALEGDTMTPTRVETKQITVQIMEIQGSKLWGISWFSDKGVNLA